MLKAAGGSTPEYGSITSSDTSAAPGNATANTRSGRSAFEADQASLTITNSEVSADSHVFAVISQSSTDATLTALLRVAPGPGAFTIFANALATAPVQVDWVVIA